MSDQPQANPSQTFFLEFIVPALFVFFVIYGLPPILEFAAHLHDSINRCTPAEQMAPAVESPSPPPSGTGPPVAGDGGDTG